MSFQTYLDNIYAKTGVTAAEFKAMAHKKGLNKHADILQWLKSEYGLGTGHARAIADVILHEEEFALPADEQIATHFAGSKSVWRETYDRLYAKVATFGSDVGVSPAASYLSLVKNGKKFAIVQVGVQQMDIGIKLKGTSPTARFVEAGSWNNMVTHRVRVDQPSQIDDELFSWLHKAYENA